jgi:chromosome segregation ATPase
MTEKTYIPENSIEQATQQIQQVGLLSVQMETLGGNVVAVQQSVSTVKSQLSEIEASLAEELQQATSTIGGLKEQAEVVEAQVKEAVGHVKVQLDSLKSKVESSMEALQTEGDQVSARLEPLTQQIEAFEGTLDSCLEATQGEIAEIQAVVVTVTSSFSDRSNQLVEDFNTFEQGIQAKLETLVEQFASLVEHGTQQLQDLETLLDTVSGETLTAVNQKLTEELLGSLTQSAGGLRDAIGGLSQVGESSKDLLDGEVGEILDKVSAVTDMIEDIKPVLDLVQKML